MNTIIKKTQASLNAVNNWASFLSFNVFHGTRSSFGRELLK